jgi:ubiquinone/menaquinone biosynthesis C-methylase UbiE
MSFHQLFKKFYATKGKEMCYECQDFMEKGAKILDLGCGCGIAGREFQKFFKSDLIGIDVVDKRVEKIPFLIFDGKNIPFPDNHFDYVLISYVLHHAKDPVLLLREAKRVARKKIIIYEDLVEDWLSELICKIHGLTFSLLFQDKKGNNNFKKEEEWKKIFDNLKLKIIFEKNIPPLLIPIDKKLFVLDKNYF